MSWCTDFSRQNKTRTKHVKRLAQAMSGYGFAVGSSGYDDEDRLVNWERSDTNLDQSWNLSAVGNWNSITENSSTQNRTHGPTHEMLTVASQSVTHDAKGNMTLIPAVLRPTNSGLPPTASRLSWDFENKLIAADTDNDSTDDIFYKFDALGRRVGRDDGTANVVYFQDGQQTIADYPSGTAAGSPTYTYVHASYIDEPVMRGGSGALRYYHRNQQYSITAVSDGGGSVVERYAYSAYGQVTFVDASGSEISNSAISNRFTYTGREWDNGLSLYHYRARMYDSVAGRFASRDPMGFGGSKWNFYQYVQSSPVCMIDPSGLFQFDVKPLSPGEQGLLKDNCKCITSGGRKDYDELNNDDSVGGFVYCNGDKIEVKIKQDETKSTGHKITEGCVAVHERFHITQLNFLCPDICKGKGICFPEVVGKNHPVGSIQCNETLECGAYRRELDCLIGKYKGLRDTLSRDDKEAIKNAVWSAARQLRKRNCELFISDLTAPGSIPSDLHNDWIEGLDLEKLDKEVFPAPHRPLVPVR
jgi:RHS repeat-associated protein